MCGVGTVAPGGPAMLPVHAAWFGVKLREAVLVVCVLRREFCVESGHTGKQSGCVLDAVWICTQRVVQSEYTGHLGFCAESCTDLGANRDRNMCH